MRNAKWWCGAKNNEAPQNFDSASRVSSSRAKSRDLSSKTVSLLIALFDHRLLLGKH